MTEPAADRASLHRDAVVIPEPRHPLLKLGTAYWRSKLKPDGRLPGRVDIDPLEMRAFLPHVFLIDVLDAETYRVRLLGSVLSELYGGSFAGRALEDAVTDKEALESFRKLYRHVCRSRAPVFNTGHVFWVRDRTWLDFEGAQLPLAADGRNVDMIFGIAALTPRSAPQSDQAPG